MLSPISLSLKTENTHFSMNRLITLLCPLLLIPTANSRTTLCAFLGCWPTLLQCNLVFLSHQVRTLPFRSDFFAAQVGSSFLSIRVRIQFSRAEVDKAAAAHFVPDSLDNGLLSMFLATSKHPLNLQLPTISLSTTNCVSVVRVFRVCSVRACGSITRTLSFCLHSLVSSSHSPPI
jgi:hypothetical protein